MVGIQEAYRETGIYLPLQAQVTLDTTGRMLLGTDISAVLVILEGLPLTAVGLNCSTGPDYMREPIRLLGDTSCLPISCIPNAGLPLNVDGQAVYPLEPGPFADTMADYVRKFGVGIVGGCCGTTPEHLRLLVEQLRGASVPRRPIVRFPSLASSTQTMPMVQQPPPFLIGERLNTQGSQKFKKMILVDDFDGALELARQQVDNGAHGLDLCTALTERSDELALMRRLVKTLAPTIRVPLIIDTTEPDVMEAALQTAPGKCLLNSTNLEAGRAKAERIFALASKYNAAVIALTIDEQGMAKSAGRKVEIAQRIHAIAVDEFDLSPENIVFDALTFTLATGDPEFAGSAIETIDGIRQIKSKLPGVLTSLGVSNVSFGLSPAARAVLNSVMLHHCVEAGLDMAMVNPAQITPYAEINLKERELADDLILNRKPDALQRLIEHFEQIGGTRAGKVDSNLVFDPAGHKARRIGAMTGFIEVQPDNAALIAAMADPAIRIVSLTVTEGGYFVDPATGRFDPDAPEIVADAASPTARRPPSARSLQRSGFAARPGSPPFTVMSCDNLPGNGHVTQDAVAGLAALSDPELADWVRANVAFPNGMVDRITPATGPRERALAAKLRTGRSGACHLRAVPPMGAGGRFPRRPPAAGRGRASPSRPMSTPMRR